MSLTNKQKWHKRKEKYNEKRRKKYVDDKNDELFDDWIYCIDIETSTIDNAVKSNGERTKCSYVISACTSRINIKTGTLEHYKFDRTYTDINETIYQIYNSTKKSVLIYCHNFAYEFDFFKNNIPFFQDIKSKQIYVKSHKPLSIKCDHVEFRCSYLLTNLSVKVMGDKLSNLLKTDWHKLDYEYNKIRTPLDKLSDDEIKYNYRDTDIVCLYIYHFILNKYGIYLLHKKIYTITSTARVTAEQLNDYKTKQDWLAFNRKCLARSEEQLMIWQKIFSGGLVTSNPNYFMKCMKNVASFDFSSAYPYTMIANNFPIQFKTKSISKNYFKTVIDDTRLNVTLYFNAIIKFQNLRINDFKYPVQSVYKAVDLISDVSINGKIVTAKQCSLYLTSLDFFMLSKFYKWDDFDVVYYEETRRVSHLPKYVLNTIHELLKRKSEYKKYNSMIEHATVNQFFQIDNKELSDLINSYDDLDIKQYVMKDEYLTQKGLLNAQYGVNVQSPLNTNIEYDFEELEYNSVTDTYEKYVSNKNPKTNLCVGMYITAFARFNLLTVLYMMLKNDVVVYYTDTDSLKVDYTDKDKVDKIINEYNLAIVKNDFGIGVMDYEDTYEYFVTNGNKSYITLKDNYIHATISGLPKASTVYNNLFKKCDYDFEKMISSCYVFNTKLDYTVTQKLTTKYGDKDINEIDINQKTSGLLHVKVGRYDDYVYTGTILEDCDLTIRDIENSKTQLTTALVLNRIFEIDKKFFFNRYYIKNDDDGYKIEYVGEVDTKIKELFI